MSKEVTNPNEITIRNDGAIGELKIVRPTAGGIVELRGRNGSGKSTALAGISRLMGGEGNVKLKDRSLKGEIVGLGARVTIGGTVRRPGGSDDLIVHTLEGLDTADLISGRGLQDPKAADRERIEVLVQLSGNVFDSASPDDFYAPFYELVGGRENFCRYCLGIEFNGNILDYAAQVKKEFQRWAVDLEKQRDEATGSMNACQTAAGKYDPKEVPALSPDALQKSLEVALQAQGEIAGKVTAATATKAAADAARSQLAVMEAGNADDIDVLLDAFKTRKLDLENATEETSRLKSLLETAEKVRIAALLSLDDSEKALKVATDRQADIQKFRATISAGDQETGPTEQEINTAARAVEIAREAIRVEAVRGAAAKQYAAALDWAEKVGSLTYKAETLRKAAKGVDGILSDVVSRSGGPIRVVDGRLVVDTPERGETYFAELSPGQRTKIAFDVFAQAAGEDGAFILGQEYWEGLDPIARQEAKRHAEACKATVFTARATDDPALTAETL